MTGAYFVNGHLAPEFGDVALAVGLSLLNLCFLVLPAKQ